MKNSRFEREESANEINEGYRYCAITYLHSLGEPCPGTACANILPLGDGTVGIADDQLEPALSESG